MGRHQEDLIKRLDQILGKLDLELAEAKLCNQRGRVSNVQRKKVQYVELKRVLLEVGHLDREVANIPTRTLPSF